MNPEQRPVAPSPELQRQLSPLPETVDVRRRAQVMLETVDFLDRASKNESYIAASKDQGFLLRLSEAERSTLGQRVSTSTRNKNRLLQVARNSFHAVYEQGNGPVRMDDPEFMSALGGFMSLYEGRKHNAARKVLKRNLTMLVQGLSPEQLEFDSSIDIPEHTAAAKQAKPPQTAAEQKPDTTERLSTTQKLQALRDDVRAGFLPATHAEKTKALAFLDYMDNPMYPANISHQFQEVFLRQHRKLDLPREEAAATLTSIGFELGDFFLQAHDQAIALGDLAARIDECPNPNVTLVEELGDNHPGYAALIRYMDILPVREKGIQISPKDPLRSKENRGPQTFIGKNKTVEDSYTAETPRPVIRERIVERIHTLTIGELRAISREAAHNEQKRATFWAARLYDTYGHGAVWRASKQVLASVGLPINPKKLA